MSDKYVIDKIYLFEIEDDESEIIHNSLVKLDRLACGLNYLSWIVDIYQQKLVEIEPLKNVRFSMGDLPSMHNVPGIPLGLVECAFHWYAVTICNYVKLVGWLASLDSVGKAGRGKFINEYINEVVPTVKVFRDKIAAHFALSAEDPRGRDNPAEKRVSMHPSLSLQNGVVYVTPLVFHTGPSDGKAESESDSLQPWSLTKVHAELVERYPNLHVIKTVPKG